MKMNGCPGGVCDDFVRAMRIFTQTGSEATDSTTEELNSGPHIVAIVVQYLNWMSIHDAAEASCPTCDIFRRAILCFFPEADLSALNPPLYITVCHSKGPEKALTAKIACNSNLDWYGARFYVGLYAPEDTKLRRWPLLSAPTPAHSFPLEAKLQQINSWLKDCRNKHEACCSSGGRILANDSTPLPRRVLDVSPPDCDLRLYESNGEKHRYVCLSHRWGDSQPLSTTSATLEARKQSIPWEIVPKTFQDAVDMTRKLGIRYLWIDSLCIIQDDADDWNEQSSRMCDIYQNGFLTIAATRALGCEDSLLPSFQHNVDGFDEHGSRHQIAVRLKDTHLYTERFSGSLLNRGWVFQERLLSRRMLHFGHDELFWECMECMTCECPTGLFCPGLDIKSIRTRIPEGGTKEDRRTSWQTIVQGYTSLSLTKISDRRVAILGLAAEMAPHRKGRYLAGLWEDTLISDLAWERLGGESWIGNARPPQTLTRTPTWSWASIDDACTYFHNWKDGDTTVLAIREPDAGNLPADGRALGCLTLRGRLITGTSCNTPPTQKWESWFSHTFGFWGKGLFVSDCDRSLNTELSVQVPDGELVFCLELGSATITSSERGVIGLVLILVDKENQLYERIGLVSLRSTRQVASRFFFYRNSVDTIIDIV